MKFFEHNKDRNKIIEKNKEKIKELFDSSVDDPSDYKTLYAYNSYLENGMYVYQSLIIAYRVSDMSLLILETDKDFKECSSVIVLKKGDFFKTSYSKNTNTYRFYVEDDPIIFSIIDKNYLDEDLLAIINQELELSDFYEFYLDFKKKTYLRKRRKK